MREYAEFQQSYAQLRRGPASSSSSLDVVAHPLSDNLFEWHFTLRGAAGTPYAAGLYHGRILLPSTYPFRPPDVVLLTPSGRFEVGKKICLSISSFHPANWQPSWSIRTVLTALMAFFPTPAAGAIGSLEYTDAEKVQLAAKSAAYTCPQCKQSNASIMRSHEEEQQAEEEEEEEQQARTVAPVAVTLVEPPPSSASSPLSTSAAASGTAASSFAPSAASSPSTPLSSASAAPLSGRSLGSAPSPAAVSSTSFNAPLPPAASISLPSSSAHSSAAGSAAASSPGSAPLSAAVPAASSSASPPALVVVSTPGKLSRATVFLSVLIAVLLLRKLLSHLLAQQQQQHHISLFHNR